MSSQNLTLLSAHFTPVTQESVCFYLQDWVLLQPVAVSRYLVKPMQICPDEMWGEVCWCLLKLFVPIFPWLLSREWLWIFPKKEKQVFFLWVVLGTDLRSSGHQPANKFDAHKRAEPRELKGKMEPTSPLANGIALFSYCSSQTELGFLLLAAKNVLTDSGRQPKTRHFAH